MAVNRFIGKISGNIEKGILAYNSLDFGAIETPGMIKRYLEKTISDNEYVVEDGGLFVMGFDNWGSKTRRVAK